MANEKKRSAVGPDGVACFDCCVHERKGKFGADDALDVDIKLDDVGQVDLYVRGCRHVASVIDSSDRGVIRRIRFAGRTYVIIACEERKYVDLLHADLLEAAPRRPESGV